MQAWTEGHAESTGQGFRGMLTKLRCLNPCEKVQMLVTSLWESLTATWPEEMRNTLLEELRAIPNLDWPVPAASLRPAADRPKLPPLYEPRRSFVPEIEDSPADLP
jgi:hypothetical protein